MGWLFTELDRDALIRELTLPCDGERSCSKVVQHLYERRESVLWSLVHLTAKVDGVAGLKAGESTYYIRCDLLERGPRGWGFKGLDESMHPYFYGCPLEYLRVAPEMSPAWRQKVRAYHDQTVEA